MKGGACCNEYKTTPKIPAAPRSSKLSIKEGDWFAVPLRSNGYAVGVVARKGKGGVLFGYFFGPKRRELPRVEDLDKFTASDAIMVEQFGDLGMRQGDWPVLGHHRAWSRDRFPLPRFGRVSELMGQTLAFRTTYSDELELLSEDKCTVDEARALPQEGLAGSGAVEIGLTQLLDKDNLPPPSAMGTSDAGPFSNDAALDYRAEVVDGLVRTIEEFADDPEIDETFGPAFAALALLNILATHASAHLPEPNVVRRWRKSFLECYDTQIDGMQPDPEFKVKQREALVRELDQLATAAKDYHG